MISKQNSCFFLFLLLFLGLSRQGSAQLHFLDAGFDDPLLTIHMGVSPVQISLSPLPPGTIFGNWELEQKQEKEVSLLEFIPNAPIPGITQGFFCRFEDRIGKKLGFGIDFGTEVKP